MSPRPSPIEYAAMHALMEHQREERRRTGRPLRTGDLVQAQTGGEIVPVIEHECAGAYVERKALERPGVMRGSSGERCAMYGGSSHWEKE